VDLLDGELAATAPNDAEVTRLGTEARFALEQARTAGAAPAVLRPVAQRLVARMCRVALDREEAEAAANWLELVADPPNELVGEVEALRQALAERAAELERLARDADVRRGQGARARAAALLAIPSGLGVITAAVADQVGWIDHSSANTVMLGLATINVSVMMFLAVRARQSGHGRASQTQAALSVLGGAGVFAVALVCWVAAIPFPATVALIQVTAGSGSSVLAVYEPRAFVAVAVHAVFAAAALAIPGPAWSWLFLGTFGGFAALGWAWSSRRRHKRG